MDQTTNRTALVTGAARGIGASIVSFFNAHGVKVIAPGRKELDLADPASVDRFIVLHQDKPIDILINNAGINILNPLDRIDADTWLQMFQVNLHAPFRLLQAFSRPMKERNWGRIVNISSVLSLVTREGRTAYSTVKSGLNGLTRAAAVELGPSGVLVNAVCPGYVETELTRQNNSPADLDRIAQTIPLRRLAQPEEIAEFVGFLCSDQNTYITGQTMAIDGGFTCL